MKTKKLNLNNLKVESFVTSINFQKSETIKAGTGGWLVKTQGPGCQVATNGVTNGAECMFNLLTLVAPTVVQGPGQNGESGPVCPPTGGNGGGNGDSVTGCPGSDPSLYEINTVCQG